MNPFCYKIYIGKLLISYYIYYINYGLNSNFPPNFDKWWLPKNNTAIRVYCTFPFITICNYIMEIPQAMLRSFLVLDEVLWWHKLETWPFSFVLGRFSKMYFWSNLVLNHSFHAYQASSQELSANFECSVHFFRGPGKGLNIHCAFVGPETKAESHVFLIKLTMP